MAEIKSMKIKSTREKKVKKIEYPKIAGEVQQVAEQVKPREINWDVIGFSSAAITLFSASLLFMLGWAYEVNWYGYFGINVSQINFQPQNILIQSIPALITLFTLFISFIVMISILRFIAEFDLPTLVTNLKKGGEPAVKEERTLQIKNFILLDWVLIFLLVEATLLFMSVLSWSNANKVFGKLNTIYEVFYLEFLGRFLIYTLVALLIVLVLSVVISFIIRKTKKREVGVRRLVLATPQKTVIFSVFGFLILLTSISISANYAINDAARGVRGSGGWSIQPMLLINSERIPFGELINQSCTDSYCVSGPYGFIGENDTNFILIKWKENTAVYFEYHPGLYIIPKNGKTYLIPVNNSSPSLSPQPVLTPISTATAFPTLIPSITPAAALTPTPTVTAPTPIPAIP